MRDHRENLLLLSVLFSFYCLPDLSLADPERPELSDWWSSINWGRHSAEAAPVAPRLCQRAIEAFSSGTAETASVGHGYFRWAIDAFVSGSARVVDGTFFTLGHSARAMFYPVYLGGQLMVSSPPIFSSPREFGKGMGSYFRKTWPHALGYLGLLALSKNVATPWRVIESSTSDFGSPTDDELVVVVIGNSPETAEGKLFINAAKRMYGNHSKLIL